MMLLACLSYLMTASVHQPLALKLADQALLIGGPLAPQT